MRYAPMLPSRRPLFGRRRPAAETVELTPTSEERRLIDRIIRHVGQRGPR